MMKKLVIYGDSISTVTHGNGGYEALLGKALAAETVCNFAVGSSGLTKITPRGMLEVLEAHPAPDDADLFLIWHGSNDWYWGSSIEEFSVSIRAAVEKLRAASPMAVLVWVTPIYRFEQPDGMTQAGEAYELLNKKGHTMVDYYLELERSGHSLGFPLIDMHSLCGIHRYNVDLYLEDRVHPNQAGYARIAAVLERELKRLLL